MAKRQKKQSVAPAREENPEWVQRDPEGQPLDPPVQTRSTRLPFTELEWKDFERLCRRLAEKAGNVECVWSYGTSGQAQFGIDILVRLADGTYEVWQTKRYQKITPAAVSDAIDLFLAHAWAAQAKRFVLAVACGLESTAVVEAIEKGRDLLTTKSIAFEPLDGSKLSDDLRTLPEIVDDYFGRPWVEAICPPEALEKLASRLSRFGRNELRKELRDCYSSWISTVDPGLPVAGLDRLGRTVPAIPIASRYVAPDILVRIAASPHQLEQPSAETETRADAERSGIDPTMARSDVERSRRGRAQAPRLREQRFDLDRFLLTTNRATISGDAGTGKSTLLRVVALDILADEPQLAVARTRYAGYIPVLVPFALWTRMAQGKPSPPSLDEVIVAFLLAQSAPRLADEIKKALASAPILLLVDGLDEASDTTAARTVAAVLAASVEARNLPVLVTARPHGLQAIGGFASTWTRAELAPLSDAQRHSLAKLWFRVLEELERGGEADPSKLDAQAERRARSLTDSLTRSPGIARLSHTPLFLLALMELHRHGHEMPRSRFAAIDEIVKQLVEHQPSRRATGALLTAASPALNPRQRDRLLDDFAFALQSGELVGSITDAAAEGDAIVRASEIILERQGTRNRDEAETSARSVFEFAEERAGLLVKKAAGTVGFLHLSLQEFLAARYLTQLPLPNRLAFVRDHAEISRWREPILYLLYLTRNETEVGELVLAIEQGTISSAHGGYVRDSLLTDAVFADFPHDIAIARRVAERLLDDAELTEWGARLRQILSSAVDGLTSETVATLCAARISRWIPNRHGYRRASALRGMAKWPSSIHHSCSQVLLRSLGADEESTWRAAAEVLPMLDVENEAKDKLEKLIEIGPSVGVITSALYALGCGWMMDPAVGSLALAARATSEPALAMEAIRLRAKRTETDEKDFERFLELNYRGRGFRDELQNRDLIEHFARTRRTIFIEYLRGEIEKLHDRNPNDLTPLVGSLILCDPDNPLVHDGMLDLLKHDWNMRTIFAEPSFPSDKIRWTPDLISEIDRFATGEKAHTRDFELYWISKVLPLASIKARILKSLASDRYSRFWSADALVEVWGGSDREVQAALLPFLNAEPDDVATVAEALSAVVEDKKMCRAALLRALRSTARVDLTIRGLRKLGISQDDDEAYRACLESVTRVGAPLYQGLWREHMILTFPSRAEVREIAIKEMEQHDGAVGAIATSYAADREITSRLLEVLSPLTESARLQLVGNLQLTAAADSRAAELLKIAQEDTEHAVSTEATIGWIESLAANGAINSSNVDALTEELDAVGPTYEERRAAAVIGLAIAGRLDRFAQATDSRGEPLTVRVARGYLRDDDRYIRRVLLYWPQLTDALGDEEKTIERLEITPDSALPLISPNEPNAQRLFENLMRKAPSSPHLSQHVQISALARFAPRSQELRSMIAPLLLQLGRGEYWGGLVAAEVFAEHFTEDLELRQMVIAAFEHDPRSYAAAALAELSLRKPDASIKNLLREKTQNRGYDVATHFKLVAALSSPQRVTENLKSVLQGGLHDLNRLQLARWVPAIVRRIERDPELQAVLKHSLAAGLDSSAKASFVSLIQRASGIDNDLRNFVLEELGRSRGERVPEIGFDLGLQVHRIVRHVFIEALA